MDFQRKLWRILSRKYSRTQFRNNRLTKDECSFNSFIESRGQPLLDLYLYISFDNYNEATRSTLSRLLKFPQQYMVPPTMRAAAAHRTEHLGISSYDIEDSEERRRREEAPGSEQIPRSLLKRQRETVTSLLGRAGPTSPFKLYALSTEFLDPLEELLGDEEFLFGEEPVSLDCFLFGYLALALYPEMPQPWLRQSLKERYPSLVAYTDRMRKTWFSETSGRSSGLPWMEQTGRSVKEICVTTGQSLADTHPWFRSLKGTQYVESGYAQQADDTFIGGLMDSIPLQLVAWISGTTALAGALAYGFTAKPKKADFGEAGSFFGIGPS